VDLAIERADLYCLVRVAGLAIPLPLTKEVALADFQRCVEAAGLAVPQRFVEEAGLAGPAMVVDSRWLGGAGLPNLCIIPLRGYSTEYAPCLGQTRPPSFA
jgi:hypothetical protein